MKLIQILTLSSGDNNVKDTHSSAESSDTEDEEFIEGRDDKESEEEELEEMEGTAATQPTATDGPHVENDSDPNTIHEEPQEGSIPPRRHSQTPTKSKSLDHGVDKKKITSSSSFDSLMDDRENKESTSSKEKPTEKKKSVFTFDIPAKKTFKNNSDSRKCSTVSDPGVPTENQQAQRGRLRRQGAVKAPHRARSSVTTSASAPQLQTGAQDKWANRRYVYTHRHHHHYKNDFTIAICTIFSSKPTPCQVC